MSKHDRQADDRRRSEAMFRSLVKQISEYLRGRGYSRRGNSFRTRTESGDVLIQVQRSQQSSVGHILFTLNLGAYCDELARITSERVQSETLTIPGCHARRRLAPVRSRDSKGWWSLTSSDSAEQIASEVREALSSGALASCEELSSLDHLLSHWQRGDGVGLTDAERLKYLGLTLAERGSRQAARETAATLEAMSLGRPWEPVYLPTVQLIRSRAAQEEDA